MKTTIVDWGIVMVGSMAYGIQQPLGIEVQCIKGSVLHNAPILQSCFLHTRGP